MREWLLGLVMVLASLAAAAEPVPFLFFGDSITAGLGDDGVDCEDPSTFAGYPPRLGEMLRQEGFDVEVRNEGLCGETTAEGLTRIDALLPEMGRAGVMVLMEGTNDVSAGISLETIRFNLGEMAAKAEGYRLVTVMSSIIPRRPDGGRDGNNARAYSLMEQLAADAAAAGRPFADPFSAMIDLPGIFLLYYSDPWHPNPMGYDLMTGPFVAPAQQAIAQLGEPTVGECRAGPARLCLNQERFEIVVDWFNQKGEVGIGKAVALTPDTGYFWFGNPDNVELLIKVLDGRRANDHFWVFYGALSNVAYAITVTDTETGAVTRYDNPLGTFASVGDTLAFFVPEDEPGDPGGALQPAPPSSSRPPPAAGTAGQPACVADEHRLCLNDGRFALEVAWRDQRGRTGIGTALPISTDTGIFWFFRDANLELVVKVLDGRRSNGHFWVFYGALSNVAYTLTVTDTASGAVRVYDNPLGTFASVGDTLAFPDPPP